MCILGIQILAHPERLAAQRVQDISRDQDAAPTMAGPVSMLQRESQKVNLMPRVILSISCSLCVRDCAHRVLNIVEELANQSWYALGCRLREHMAFRTYSGLRASRGGLTCTLFRQSLPATAPLSRLRRMETSAQVKLNQ